MVRRGRRFESVRGLCKSPAKRGFFVLLRLHCPQRAAGVEPFMEPSGPEVPPPGAKNGHIGRDDVAFAATSCAVCRHPGNTDSGMPVAVDENAVWVLRFVGGQLTLFRVDPGTNEIVARIPVGP